MKSSETNILVIPGYDGSGEAHWQRRLAAKLPSARVVEQADWLHGSLPQAIAPIVQAVKDSEKPSVFVVHSAGCALVAHSVFHLREAGIADRVRGAFLVAPTSAEALGKLHGIDPLFKNVPRDPLPFPSMVIASSNDPFVTLEQAADIASAWGSQFVEAGPQGHINTDSGHGPWPEGMMKFAGWLSKLG